MAWDIKYRLRKRAEIRRGIPRAEPDRISDILEEAADRIQELEFRARLFMVIGAGTIITTSLLLLNT